MIQPTVVVTQPTDSGLVSTTYGYTALSDFEVAILWYRSQGKASEEIATLTGVAEVKVKEKAGKLRAGGYLTEKDALSEKGFEAVKAADEGGVHVAPAPTP